MNKKKVDSILKGVTAAGLTIGGVSSIQGADMVMAQMVESTASETTEMESDIEAASTSAETSQSITERATEIASESANSQSSSAETKDSNVESQAMEYVYTNKVVETKQEISAAENENINVASTEEVVVTASVSRTGTGSSICIRKFDDYNAVRNNTKAVSYHNIVLAHLTETYLIAAEAYYMAGDETTSLARLNVVRERSHAEALTSYASYKRHYSDGTAKSYNSGSGIGNVPFETNLNPIDVILDERARELCGEYYRWMDLPHRLLENKFLRQE